MFKNKAPIKLGLSKLALLLAILITARSVAAETAEVPAVDQDKSRHGGFGFRRLSIEAYGQYTFQPQSTNGTQATSSLNGNGQTQLNFVLPTMDGPGIGARIEAEFFPKVSLTIGGQYKSLGIKYKAYYSTVAGSPASTLIYSNSAEEFSYKTWMLDLGLRARTPLLWGEVYGGLGIGFIMPFQSSYVASYDFTAGYGTTASSIKSTKTTKNYNLGIAGIAEIGYQYPISSRISFGISLTVIFGSVSNANKNGETSFYYGDGSTSKTTREYRKTFSIDEASAFSAANNGNSSLAIYESLNITDIGIRGMISLRIF